MKTLKTLYTFQVPIEKEVEETVIREDGDKKISETQKVKKKIKVEFAFKQLSRVDREKLTEERAIWETYYINKGILPEALLIKIFANHGGMLSEDQAKQYRQLQLDLTEAERQIQEATLKENEDLLKEKNLRFLEIKDAIIAFQEEQSYFFKNTAEAMAKQKITEWLVLNFSYYKPHKNNEEEMVWEPFFKGENMEEKLAVLDSYIEGEDELFAKSREVLEFVAMFYASSTAYYNIEDLAAFADTLVIDT